MENFHRRHHHSFKTKRIVIGFLLAHFYLLGFSQSRSDEEKMIQTFLESEYVELMLKAKDYKAFVSQNTNLASALSFEINTSTMPINENAIIEYENVRENGRNITITDRIHAFLVNYAGRQLERPKINIECIQKETDTYFAYFKSTNEVSPNDVLRRAVFKKLDNNLELRRISFAAELASECLPKNNQTEKRDTQVEKIGEPTPLVLMPQIIIKEARLSDGLVSIYGIVQNFKANGLLSDLESNNTISISPIDGFFILKKPLTTHGHLEIQLKYSYGRKFITNRKLIFVKW